MVSEIIGVGRFYWKQRLPWLLNRLVIMNYSKQGIHGALSDIAKPLAKA